MLKWSTASEQNSRLFVIQKSTDGLNWTAIAEKQAAGNSNAQMDYSYTDAGPVEGINYYRIQLNDIDGRNYYSKTVSVQYSNDKMPVIYPNPVTEGKLNIEMKESGYVRLYNNQGMLEHQVLLEKGIQTLHLDRLAKGIYQLKTAQGTASIVIQ